MLTQKLSRFFGSYCRQIQSFCETVSFTSLCQNIFREMTYCFSLLLAMFSNPAVRLCLNRSATFVFNDVNLPYMISLRIRRRVCVFEYSWAVACAGYESVATLILLKFGFLWVLSVLSLWLSLAINFCSCWLFSTNFVQGFHVAVHVAGTVVLFGRKCIC